MGVGHGLNAAIEHLQELFHGAAALARALSNGGNGSEHVLDAVVELADQQALSLLGSLALRDVAGQSLETQIAAVCVELRLARLLEPYLPPVHPNEAKGS